MAVAACETPPLGPASDFTIVALSGSGQLAAQGAELAQPLTVQVLDGAGIPAKGVRVRFARVPGPRGGGTLLDSVAITGINGRASARAAAGVAGDTLRVEASIAFLPGRATRFIAVAEAGPEITKVSPTNVRAGDTLTIEAGGIGTTVLVRFGEVGVAPVAGSTGPLVRVVVPACLDSGPVSVVIETGGARSNTSVITYHARRASLTLQPYAYTTIPAAQLADCVELDGGGATYLVAGEYASAPRGPFNAAAWQLGVTGVAGTVTSAATTSAAAAGMVAPRGVGAGELTVGARGGPGRIATAEREFDMARRALERRIAGHAAARPTEAASPGAAGPQAIAGSTSRADASAPAPGLGTIRSFHVVSSPDGSTFEEVDGVLDYAGEHVLVYTDLNDARLTPDLFALAALMDRHLWGTAVSTFGADPDVDGNGRIIVLFTPVVNRLAKAEDCVLRGYVSGFFYPTDLIERAPHSNRGEVFYAFTPDPTGRYSCAHSERQVIQQLQPTFLHEMEHLIAYNEHVLARGGPPEETWLAEGLGHIAEELGSRYFESRYPAPFGRSSPEQLFPDSSAPFIGPLLLDSYVYLGAALGHSVTAYNGAGSLEDGGATWLFLRWLADQKGDDLIRRLVQTRLTGVANVEAAAGERFAPLFGDFSLALFADSLPGIPRAAVPPRLRFAGRSLRQLMAREATVQGFPVPFPLVTYLAGPGVALHSQMPPGTMVHAIVPSDATTPRIRFSFTTLSLAPLDAALGAQVGILRLPP